jgi:hypothetical protein
MPKNTDIYGFTYPCPGDTVDGVTFKTLADQIDVKLNDVNNDWIGALQRRNIDTGSATQAGIAAGVDTVITAADSQYTLPAAGIWLFSIEATPFGWTTINMARLRVRQNGVVKFGHTVNTENNNQYLPRPRGPIVGAAGDVISTTFLFNGTGTVTVGIVITGKLIVRLA